MRGNDWNLMPHSFKSNASVQDGSDTEYVKRHRMRATPPPARLALRMFYLTTSAAFFSKSS